MVEPSLLHKCSAFCALAYGACALHDVVDEVGRQKRKSDVLENLVERFWNPLLCCEPFDAGVEHCFLLVHFQVVT